MAKGSFRGKPVDEATNMHCTCLLLYTLKKDMDDLYVHCDMDDLYVHCDMDNLRLYVAGVEVFLHYRFTVKRGGKELHLLVADIVVGDLVYFSYGKAFPADGLVLEVCPLNLLDTATV